MPLRNLLLAKGEIYHVFNRSIAKTNIFHADNYLQRSINTIDYYRYCQKLRFSMFGLLSYNQQQIYLSSIGKSKPIVEIYVFSIMPNHFHFLIKQLVSNGIAKFIGTFQNSYAKFFNTLNKREGSLFQDRFKAKRITTNEELIHVSRYIHLNPVSSSLITFKELAHYPYTSYYWYLNPQLNRFVSTSLILNYFKSLSRYSTFLADNANYQLKLHNIDHLL